MSPQVFLLPDLGEGLVEAELVTWLVAVGDTIHVDQPIAEVETAKSVVEVPSPFEGTVETLHGAEGDTLEVGKPLISVAALGSLDSDAAVPAGEAAPTPARPQALPGLASSPQVPRASGPTAVPTTPWAGAAAPALGTSAPDSPLAAAPEPSDAEAAAVTSPVAVSEPAASGGSGNVLIGYGTSSHGGPGRTRPSRRSHLLGVSGVTAAVPASAVPHRAHLVVSPLVRKMAHDNGVALADIHGSGAGGLILRRDVEAAIAPVAAPGADHADAAEAGGAGVVDPRTGLHVLARTPLTGVKKAAATALARSRREIPEATVWVDVDATALLELRASLKAKDGTAPSILAFVARFVTAGLARFPQLNTQLVSDGGTDTVVEFDGINLGFAAQTDRGLVVPVLRGAQGRSARALDGAIRELTGTARDGKAGPAQLSGGTFTINNYGVFGVDGSAAIINYPEAAMLGIGRITDKPWVVDGQLCVRKLTELTLAFDHRVCDGAVAAGFLRFIADAMENPASALAEL
ncbi:2-oxo acid dehydrogenase subunit E2 [Arthrobacter sp. ERGS1:01]|uniref:2-oxo acid dehydrogenase subunit E2 n=1 Tax=Arthrobacter sp. ERGS1:01 TaxID=1704044 RepID=UPI000AED15DF|nr:2-oxo acid dehydrogenase subunit E2 [Arthrobacter sp. ERGS1:01]